MLSKGLELKKNDYISWFRTSIIIYIPMGIYFLLSIENYDLNIIKILTISVILDLIRRFFKDYQGELIVNVEEADMNEIEKYLKI